MRIILLSLFTITLLTACLNNTDKEKQAASQTNSQTSVPKTRIQWLDSSKSLGTVPEGEMIKVAYRFTNSGDNPLIIENVQAGCGCTVADYPKNPIAPGNSGEILATFNSNGRVGTQKKNLTVYANTPENAHPLWFDVVVKATEKKPNN